MRVLLYTLGMVLIPSVIWNGKGAADEAHVLRAGVARVDISPKTLPAIKNGGFLQAKADRVSDPLHARAMVLDDGGETIALVVVDSCMLPTTLCDEIKRNASEQSGIPANRILISATHTHSAPSVMDMCLGSGKDEAYAKFIPDQVARAISDAYAKLRPAKLGWAIVDGSDLTNCRRWITRSDRMGTDPFGAKTVRAMMHPGYENPSYTCPAGPIDPWLSVLSVVSATDNAPMCVLGNLSMHYFGGSPGFSADYFGDVAGLLESEFNASSGESSQDFVGIMSQGTSGDLHWMDYSRPREALSRERYSERVADRITQTLAQIRYRSDVSLAMAEKRLKIKRRMPTQGRREWARPINAARLDRPPRNRVEVYAQQAEWIHENPTAEVVLQAIRIGDVAVTAIPNEVYGITGLKLKQQSPLVATINFELSGGATGYIPPPEQHRLGGYTTWPARTAGLDEQAEPQIVETLLGLLETVSQKKRRPIVPTRTSYANAVAAKGPVAFWRLDDIDASQAGDERGRHHASFEGAVALYLTRTIHAARPEADFDDPAAYGNRCVYLAGGHVEAKVATMGPRYTSMLSFWNAIPTGLRDTTGILISNASETLQISGRSEGDHAGKLVLVVGDQRFVGKRKVAQGAWHHVTMTRDGKRVRVYLDGHATPDVDATIEPQGTPSQWRIGGNGEAAKSFEGKVDEVALFDRVLGISEVVDLYRQTGMKPPPPPKPTITLGAKPSDAKSRNRYGVAVRNSKPIAFWRLHDQSNVAAKNSFGDTDATYESGASPLQSKASQPNFTGGRVKAVVPNLDDTYTVEFWSRNELPVDARPVTAYLFSRAKDGIHGADGDSVGIGGTHANMGRLIVFNGNGRNQLLTGRTRIPRGSWSHVVMVRDGQRIVVYLNGHPEPEISGRLPVAYPDGCEEFFFGGRADQFANLRGMLEEVALYDRALTAEEVKAHYDASGVRAVTDISAASPAARKKPDLPEKPTPTDADAALRTIHVPKDFEVQLVASEPLVMDPVAIDWGPDGKLWVVEMADYPLGMDGQGKPGGRVRYLEDTDNDGQYDASTLFADGLSFPTGVLAWGEGVLVTASPEVVFLADSTGDGKADIRRVLFSGFLEGNQQLRVNGLRPGLDNWIYCASGSHHGGYGKDSQITSHLTGKRHHVGSRDFRIRPASGEFDPQSGPSQYGRNRDDWGNWFGVQNSLPLWHYVLADHQIRRNPHFAPPNPKHQVVTPSNPRVFPASKLQKRYHSFTQSGRFTSACSAMVYRDSYLFPRGAEQHAFTCEPFHNLVQHNLIADEGVSFKFRRDPGESNLDFFASEDRWCRPVMARTGPDGGLWIVDMYRYMIEHPQWLPKNGKDELRPWYRSGETHGRIYRVVRRRKPTREIPEFSRLSTTQLVAVLESSNGWQRDTAQRILITQDQDSAIDPLADMATNNSQPLARLHAFCTLDGMGKLSVDLLEKGLADPHAGVRRNAVRIAAHVAVATESLLQRLGDGDAKVRLELASTLGAYEGVEVSEALAELALSPESDEYMVAGVFGSLNSGNVSAVVTAVLRSNDGSREKVVSEMIGQAVSLGNRETIADVAESVTSQRRPLKERFTLLAMVLDRLGGRAEVLGPLPDRVRERISENARQAREVAVDPEMPGDIRAQAIALLARGGDQHASDLQLMKRLLDPQSPPTVQMSVVSRLARVDHSAVADVLLEGWTSHSPMLRTRILGVLVSRASWAESLLARLEDKTISASELDASLRQQLLEVHKESSRWMKALAVEASAGRREVLRRFRSAIEMTGDRERGEVLFRKLCLNCHKLGDEGHQVGPQLASITNKTRESFLTSIIDPNAAVDARYANYSILTMDGRVLSGKLESETGSSVVLLAAEGKRITILRREIEKMRATGKSVMPEGLEEGLRPKELADLLEFLHHAFR